MSKREKLQIIRRNYESNYKHYVVIEIAQGQNSKSRGFYKMHQMHNLDEELIFRGSSVLVLTSMPKGEIVELSIVIDVK